MAALGWRVSCSMETLVSPSPRRKSSKLEMGEKGGGGVVSHWWVWYGFGRVGLGRARPGGMILVTGKRYPNIRD